MSQPTSSTSKTAIVLCNLGTPDSPSTGAVRRYLREFLSDRRVVDIPALIWLPILYAAILPFRAPASAQKYQSIWSAEGSPLLAWTRKQALLLRGWLGEQQHNIHVTHAMRYGSPNLRHVLDKLAEQAQFDRILILPAYPQYATSTTASLEDHANNWLRQRPRDTQPHLQIVKRYADDPGYIDAMVEHIRYQWMTQGRGEKLLMSFHGIPLRSVQMGDPYQQECETTARLLAQRLGIADGQWQLSYQSRFGKARWLEPSTVAVLKQWAQTGVRSVDVFCPGFTADCLETLEEINMEAREVFLESGGEQFNYIPCLNDHSKWIAALGGIALKELELPSTQKNK